MTVSRPVLRSVAAVTALVAVALGSVPLAGASTTSGAAQVGATPRAGRAHPSDGPTTAEIEQVQAELRAAALRQPGARRQTPAALATRTRSLLRHSVIRPRAAAALTDCSAEYDGPFLCGSIQVPTNPADPRLGTRTIDFVYRPADVQPATGVSLFSDGPIQSTFDANNTWKAGFYSAMATAQGAELSSRDVILVNTRGTGRDNVDCPMLQSPGNDVRAAVSECVGILGRTIDYFTVGDAADDLEAVRAHLLGRTAKVDLVTMGHATSLGQAYLARYPSRIRTAILDEAQSMNAWGDVEIKDATAMAGLVCARSDRCSAQIDAEDVPGDLAWLAARVRQGPITGTTTLADGTPQDVRIGEVELAWWMLFPEAAAFDQSAGLPAAIKAYRAGDAQPLLRIAADSGVGDGTYGPPLTDPVTTDGADWSASGFAAAYCNEWPTAYDLSADEATRRAQSVRRLAAQPANLYGIFSHALYGNWEECWSWPGPRRVNRIQPPGVPYARVPVLVEAGDLNSDHPPTASRSVAARYPNSTFVLIPRAGQPALYWSACAARVAQHFLDHRTVGPRACDPTEGKTVLGIGSFPRTVAGEAPARPVSKLDSSTPRDRRVAAAAVHTVLDGFVHWAFHGADAGPGLRGGTWAVAYGEDDALFTLSEARFVPGITVSGDFDYSFVADNPPATLMVGGAGTDPGTLVVDMPSIFDLGRPTAHVTGQLGGRQIDVVVDLH